MPMGENFIHRSSIAGSGYLRILATFCLLVTVFGVWAQPARYTIANTHSHNDYEQAVPFWMAYDEGFGSIEADIFLKEGVLLVGHDTVEIRSGRTLEAYYLRPLLSVLQRHHGHAYGDTTRSLQLLIDVKTDAIVTLDSLIALLGRYPALTTGGAIRWAITGNRPDPATWPRYPAYIGFDGVLSRDYSPAALGRIVMLSDDLKRYGQANDNAASQQSGKDEPMRGGKVEWWNGEGEIPREERERLLADIGRAHRLGKPVRLWDAPDFANAWRQLMLLGVDYINTDHIRALGDYLRKNGQIGGDNL